MKGRVDSIVTDVYALSIPDELVEKIEADMVAEFASKKDFEDEKLRNIFLNYGDEDNFNSQRKKVRSEILLAYAWFYKDKYEIAAKAIGHHETVSAGLAD